MDIKLIHTVLLDVKDMTESGTRGLLHSANQLSINTSKQIYTDTLNSIKTNDLYSFTIQGRSSFNLSLDGLIADADVRLIRDKNANGKFDKDETIAYSNNGGTLAESINTSLAAGDYYIEVYPYGNIETNYHLTVSAVPFDSAGNTLNNAREISVDSQTKIVSDWVGKLDSQDYYRFNLSNSSDFKVVVAGLSADADLQLLSSQGNILANSINGGAASESINQTLETGTYYLKVYSYNSSETFYNLKLSASLPSQNSSNSGEMELIPTSVGNTAATSANQSSPIPTSAVPQSAGSTRSQAGTLRADTFTFESGYSRTIFSGNGNVDFGSGGRDLIDLSQFVSTSAAFNYATNPNGGVVYNSGNGNRIFDALTLSDGSQILFESIDAIRFADTTINLSVTTNDPQFSQQWNLHGMGVHNAWRFTTGTSNVMIGIQDTGSGTDSSGNIHPDLRPASFIGSNYVDEWGNFSHGTLVQGGIAARSNNGMGGAGINWNSDLMLVDVVGDNPLDYNLATATQAMIDKANAQGKRLVVNISLAGGYSVEFEQLIAANQNTALFVIASGNGNSNSIASPADLAARYGNVVAVGSSWGTQDWYGNSRNPGERVAYDNWWGSNYGNGLTVTAPSEFFTTSANRNGTGSFDFAYNDKFNGTSASTANVSGVASLVWSANSNLSAGQVKAIISETAYDLGNQGYDEVYGHGFINADAAVRRALAIARGFA
ncbi:subtilisin-like serine protease [Rivularia sp. PCC 7116]|uniref:S8 family serine peptidase n=1 Tax=Rivularia sp. PCC 7116 TaxID=373994 RepID=UPI00029ED1BC|nr:S8 family serine peptidase [Rivularia sp. PCC 7116]AFY53483.1 subtilisin-like serine protease [Rivularia sp. PCC 7116]